MEYVRTLQAFDALVAAGIPETEARAQVHLLESSFEEALEHVATKEDMQRLEVATKGDIQRLEADLRKDIVQLGVLIGEKLSFIRTLGWGLFVLFGTLVGSLIAVIISLSKIVFH